MTFPRRTTTSSHTIAIRPRYAETDRSGVVHHTIYPAWFELGRTELLRVNGTAYKDLEAAGIFFVVVELSVRYRWPAKYDEKLQLETICTKVTLTRIEHTYKLSRCSDGTILAEGSSVLACVNAQGKIQRMPDFLYPEG